MKGLKELEETQMTVEEMEEFIDIVDVPTKLHLQQYEGNEEVLERYRILRTKAEDMINDYCIMKKALKRNEPIKPKLVWKNEEDKNIAVYRCLNCNAMLGVKLDNKPIFPNFCRHCGQKLDWSSEKYD